MLIIARNAVILLAVLSGLFGIAGSSNGNLAPDGRFDVLEYEFNLELSDSSDVIVGRTAIILKVDSSSISDIKLDLISKDESGNGMTVNQVSIEGRPSTFSHMDDLISITCDDSCSANDTLTVVVSYSGIPMDGLVIAQNKFDERTFFGDNWPNRARHWLVTKDHPGDKAKVQFNVIAPSHYQVISNGKLMEENDLTENTRLTKWRSDIELPTKVMVIGVARFSVQHLDPIGDTPVSSWVYPQDQGLGFEDFYQAREVVRFMEDLIGEFPYDKLANVQSKTRYGGMENAGAIFYHERAVANPSRPIESLLAHEIAHQWFGDSVTEKDWPHIWLSEGVATYLTLYHLLETKGQEEYDKMIAQMVPGIVNFNDKNPDKAIVDYTVEDPNALLNANSYSKGGLVLHMLRQKIGDEAFVRTLRSYYTTYRDGNADSSDFESIAETESKQNLDQFFEQWLIESELPSLSWEWSYSSSKVKIDLQQLSQRIFSFSIPAAFYFEGKETQESLDIAERNHTYSFNFENRPDSVKLSPLKNTLVKLSH